MFSFAILLTFILTNGHRDYAPVQKISLEGRTREYFPLLHLIVEAYNRQSASLFSYVLFDVQDARIQLSDVATYKFDVVFASTNCSKGRYLSLANLSNCKIKGDEFRQCTACVWKNQWWFRGEPELTFENCFMIQPSVPENPYLLGFKLPANVSVMYEEFKRVYNKQHTGIEDTFRFSVFQKNLLKAQLYQVLDQGSAVYGVTPFSDLTEYEFKQTHLMAGWNLANRPKTVAFPNMSEPMPDSFDWRKKGAVTEIKNQGYCGSCWAFSTTGNIEGQWFSKFGKLVALSEQQLVDCDSLDAGCNGGLPSNAYKSVLKMGGLMSEESYPYDAKDEKCHFNRSQVSVYINNSVSLPENEVQLATWLSQNSTISVALNAMTLQFYRRGISHPWGIFCSKHMLDHAVLLVGYGQEGNTPFWIVKNSWGTEWGESGYFRIFRGDGSCGINTAATSAVVY